MNAYGWCQVVGMLVAAVLGTILSRYRGLFGWRVGFVLVSGALGALVFGRIAKALGDLPSVIHDPGLLVQFSFKGFDLVGALLGTAGVSLLVARRWSLSVLDIADCVAPGLGLAIAIQRWGCWGAGCCFGRPSSLPWAVAVEPYGSAHLAQMGTGQAELFGSPLPIHPYPLYELAIGLVVGCVCSFVWRKRQPGATIGVFLALFFLLKFLVTFTRMPDSAGDPPWVHLGVYAALVVVGVVLMRRAGKKES